MLLRDSRAKLGRAQHHFDTIETEINAFIQTKRYRLVVDKPTDNLRIIRLESAPEIPTERWGLLVGDCIHNLRSALDYIAWRLAGSDRADTNTQFPIFTTREGWQRQGVRRIRGMKTEARALIERTQPFHSTTPDLALLNVIRILDDTDKHKLITVVAAAPSSLSIDIPTTHPEIVPTPTFFYPPVLSDNAVLAMVEIPNTTDNVEVESNLTINVAFGDRCFPRRTHVIESIRNMIVEIMTTVQAFEAQPGLFHE